MLTIDDSSREGLISGHWRVRKRKIAEWGVIWMHQGIHKMRRIHKMRTTTLAEEYGKNPTPNV